jgi:DNA-binding CsgD family transcriptional regulator
MELRHMTSPSAPKRTVASLAQTLSASNQKTDFQRALLDICRTSGAKHAAFLMRHVPGVVGDDPFGIDTYGETWRKHLDDSNFTVGEPIKTLSDHARQPVDWSEMPKVRNRIKRFFRDFQDFQLGRHAITATFRGPSGDRSLLTLTSDVSEKRWQSCKAELAVAIGQLHPTLHNAVLKVRFGIDDVDVIRLTPRERECLVWAAHGHTSREIGVNLGLTAATVNFFIDSAVGKLAASNRAHAAAKAVALGLIAPPR